MALNASWYPVIENDLCVGEEDCVEVCEHNVIEVVAGKAEPVIARPHLCVEGCTLCVEICVNDAIRLAATGAGRS